MGIDLTLKGMDGLHAALMDLGAKTAVSALRAAGRKSFRPVLEAARARAPVDTGVLRDSIVIGSQKLDGDESGAGVVAVGLRVKKTKNTRTKGARGAAAGLLRSAPLIGGGAKRDASWRWHFVEKGTVNMAARPFLRPALDGQAQTVVDNLATELRAQIEKRGSQ